MNTKFKPIKVGVGRYKWRRWLNVVTIAELLWWSFVVATHLVLLPVAIIYVQELFK